MTDRIEALRALRYRVGAGYGVSEISGFLVEDAIPQSGGRVFLILSEGSLDAARSLVKAVLPGWGYRVCECYLSDDAAVFPDFNCPEHGERLKREIDPDVDWFDLTDIDQRPAGNPARALLLSILTALIAIEEQSQ